MEHLELLERVLSHLDSYNLTINKKFAFFQEEITYCGYWVDGEGLHKTPEKIQAVVDTPSPANISQLRAFLEMINYYHRLLPDLSTRLEPLHHQLQKEAKWVWSEDCEKAFKEIKQLIVSDVVLVHFNPELPYTLSCDASPYGLGAA